MSSRARTNWVNTAIDHYPKCSCDGTCTDCAKEMATELLSVLAVLNCVQHDQDPHQLPLAEGGVAETVATALWGEKSGSPAVNPPPAAIVVNIDPPRGPVRARPSPLAAPQRSATSGEAEDSDNHRAALARRQRRPEPERQPPWRTT